MHRRLKRDLFKTTLASLGLLAACSESPETIVLDKVVSTECSQTFSSPTSAWVVKHDTCNSDSTWSFEDNSKHRQTTQLEPALLRFLVTEGCTNDNLCLYEIQKTGSQIDFVLTYNVNLSSGKLSITLDEDGQVISSNHVSEDSPS